MCKNNILRHLVEYSQNIAFIILFRLQLITLIFSVIFFIDVLSNILRRSYIVLKYLHATYINHFKFLNST